MAIQNDILEIMKNNGGKIIQSTLYDELEELGYEKMKKIDDGREFEQFWIPLHELRLADLITIDIWAGDAVWSLV